MCEPIDFGTQYARNTLRKIDVLTKASTEDGLIFEDHIVKVERKDGVVVWSGKPVAFPIIYKEDL